MAIYPSSISGFRFLLQRELPPVAMCWDFQTTQAFSADSARHLLAELPEDCQLSYFDPEPGQEESWLFVRRTGQRYFVKSVRRGSSPWTEARSKVCSTLSQQARSFRSLRAHLLRSLFHPFQITSDTTTFRERLPSAVVRSPYFSASAFRLPASHSRPLIGENISFRRHQIFGRHTIATNAEQSQLRPLASDRLSWRITVCPSPRSQPPLPLSDPLLRFRS